MGPSACSSCICTGSSGHCSALPECSMASLLDRSTGATSPGWPILPTMHCSCSSIVCAVGCTVYVIAEQPHQLPRIPAQEQVAGSRSLGAQCCVPWEQRPGRSKLCRTLLWLVMHRVAECSLLHSNRQGQHALTHNYVRCQHYNAWGQSTLGQHSVVSSQPPGAHRTCPAFCPGPSRTLEGPMNPKSTLLFEQHGSRACHISCLRSCGQPDADARAGSATLDSCSPSGSNPDLHMCTLPMPAEQ